MMPATVNATHRHVNAPATSLGSIKGQGQHRIHHEYNGMAFRWTYESRIEHSCPAASSSHTKMRCHPVTDTLVISDSPASSLPCSLVSAHSPASPRPGVCASSQACHAPRRHTVELPLSDDPVEKLILQWDSSLNLTAPEGVGALGLLL